MPVFCDAAFRAQAIPEYRKSLCARCVFLRNRINEIDAAPDGCDTDIDVADKEVRVLKLVLSFCICQPSAPLL